MTLAETSKILTTLFLQYSGAETTHLLIAIWHHCLGRYSTRQVSLAVSELLQTYTGTYPPTVGMVAEIIRRRELEEESRLTDGEAWSILVDAVRRRGRYDQAGAMHLLRERAPLVARAAEMLGWDEICSWQVDDEVANRAHFWRILGGLKRERERALLPTAQAQGIIEDKQVNRIVLEMVENARR